MHTNPFLLVFQEKLLDLLFEARLEKSILVPEPNTNPSLDLSDGPSDVRLAKSGRFLVAPKI